MRKVKIIKTKTYLDSIYKLKDPRVIIAIEKKVAKLLDNPDIAKPMKYQHENFCEIPIGNHHRVYCIKLNYTIIIFILGPAIHHKKNYQKSEEYRKLFKKLETIKDEFKDESN